MTRFPLTRMLYLMPISASTSPRRMSALFSGLVSTHTRRTSSSATPKIEVTCSLHAHSPGHDVATLTINNPLKLNILTETVVTSLIDHCRALSTSATLRAVVLTGGPVAAGKPPAFIGGADIREMHAVSSPAEARSFITHLHSACQALRDLPVPVIARIHGLCLGAGLEVAASCDLRIATKLSRFAMPEVAIGIPSVIEAALLPGLIGFGRTRRLLMLGENIDAEEAERWGLVEKIVEDEKQLHQMVADWVGKLVSNGSQAVRSQKKLMRRWEECGVDEGVQKGIEAFGQAFENDGVEPREKMAAFLERKGM
ncbi:hypothetical protein B0A48_16133 [Cryoendolithus antarcticus]|uniref:Enoyl-CoA hydratase n=1 Tax=Cryoendolithus antarcticus TaxID=1507870 RepID=A0A1V8SFF3_9PEZI|nr:hypothetical protein B0A48_16133 [Cryoendolithus antarcticus]